MTHRVVSVALTPAREGLNPTTWTALCARLGLRPLGDLTSGWQQELGAGNLDATDGTRIRLTLWRAPAAPGEPCVAYPGPDDRGARGDDLPRWALSWTLDANAQLRWPSEPAAAALWATIAEAAEAVGLIARRLP